jgi:hypothetical protein
VRQQQNEPEAEQQKGAVSAPLLMHTPTSMAVFVALAEFVTDVTAGGGATKRAQRAAAGKL